MNSTNSNSFDDKDLDDAALWAVIDAAAAAAATNHRGTVAVKFPNRQQSPPTPVSYASPPPQNTKNPYQTYRYGPPDSSPRHNDRPQKMPRSCASEVTKSTPLAVVHRTTPPPAVSPPVVYRSPESCLSPGIGRFSPGSYGGSEVSPGSFGKQDEGILRHSLSGNFPSVELFKEYQNSAMAVLEKSDYTMISGNPFIKKSGWRKISFYFNLSFEIKDKTIDFDENRNVQRAEFIVRAHMQGGRFSDGWGSCDRREKRFMKPNHDVPSTAETRAKNKACQDLLGIGEYKPGISNVQR